MIEYHGNLRGDGRRFGIVVGRFNEFVTRQLLNGARDCLVRHGVAEDDVEAVWVPGAWEISGALRRLGAAGRFDALIALGAVIRGGTPHFAYVAAEAARGTAAAAEALDIPVVFGVLTTDTIEQAIERAGTKAGNKGWDAAQAALELVDVYAQIGGSDRARS